MVKRICLFIIAVIALFTCTPAIAQTAVADFAVGELAYKLLEDNKVGVVGFAENASVPVTLVIPGEVTYEDVVYKVETIEQYAFENANITNLQIGSSIVSIGDGAFKGAQFIYLYIPKSVLTIGKYCFENCTKLREIRTPGVSLAVIPEAAFRGCKNLTSFNTSSRNPVETPLIGPDVTSVGANAFKGCNSLTTVFIPDKVLEVGADAFANCDSLKRVILGKDMQTLGSGVFNGCEDLKEIIIKSTQVVESSKTIVSDATIYVDSTLVEQYKESTAWENANNTFENLIPVTYNLKLRYTNGTLEELPNVISLPLKKTQNLQAKLNGQEFMGICPSGHDYINTWTSSDTDVATVNANGTITGVGKGTAIITASTVFNYTTYSRSCEVAVDYDAPTDIKITAGDNKMALGTELTLYAEVLPAGALQQFTWSSLNEGLATISKDGVITPKTPGNARFRATSDVNPDISATFSVAIYYAKPVSIDLEIVSDTLRIGDTADIKATVNPYPHAAQTVQWFTSNDKIATVSQTGHIECLSVGKVIITAMSTNDKSIVGTKELYVDYSIPTEMTISTADMDMKVGEIRQIQFIVEPAGAEQKADWISEDNEVATVDADGNVTAVGVGTTTITGITGMVKATCSVTVDYADPVRVVLNYTGVNVNSGDSVQIVARVLPVGARQEVIWNVDNDSIASVKEDGMVFGLVKGTTYVIARAAAKPSVFEGCNIIVLEPDFEKDPGYNAIEGIDSDSFSISVNGSSLIFSGLKPGELVSIYDLNGTCVFRTVTPADGSVSAGSLRKGIYIVRTAAQAVKIKI